MTKKTLGVVSLFSLGLIVLLAFQNCSDPSFIESSSNFESASLDGSANVPVPALTKMCTKQLDDVLNFEGPGGGVWSHTIAGNLPHLTITSSTENAQLNLQRFERTMSAPEPGKCTFFNFFANKNPADNLGKSTPLKGSDLTDQKLEILVQVCTDPLSRFVSVFHFSRDWENPLRPIGSVVFQGVLPIGNAECVSEVKMHTLKRNDNFLWSLMEVVRQDQKRDAYVFPIDGVSVSATFARLRLDLDSVQANTDLSLITQHTLLDTNCSSDRTILRIDVEPTEFNSRIYGSLNCGAATIEQKKLFFEL